MGQEWEVATSIQQVEFSDAVRTDRPVPHNSNLDESIKSAQLEKTCSLKCFSNFGAQINKIKPTSQSLNHKIKVGMDA